MQDNTLQELQAVKSALAIEREEDLQQFKATIQALPLDLRRKKGFTWYPVVVNKTGYTIGDRVFVVVEKQYESERAHLLRAGNIVALFTRQPHADAPESPGVIYSIDKRKMVIHLNARDLPDWINEGDIGVDLLFDDRSYQEMNKALEKVIKAKGDRLAELRDLLMGIRPPRVPDLAHTTYPVASVLNESQKTAVLQMLTFEDLLLIHGPPGTGKTTTLVHGIKALSTVEHSILVCAPSNTAADLLTERIAEMGLNVVRIGNISRVDESLVHHTLEVKIANDPESKHIKKLKIQAAELRKKGARFKRTFDQEARQERADAFKEAGELMKWARQLEDRLLEQILDAAQVITCTLVGAANQVLERRHFPTVIIDEAAQALEPATWLPITKASKVVLTGDPYQLPPTVKSAEAARKGLNRTLLEKALVRVPAVVHLLDTQYRMHELIMGFSNQYFYNGALKAAPAVQTAVLPIPDNQPIVFIDTAGCGFEEQVNKEYQSRANPDEFLLLREHLLQLVHSFEAAQIEIPEIALISPYREQVIWMENYIAEDDTLKSLPLVCNTIDGFQGQERAIVYISLVRSNTKGEIGFLKDYRRMNVAMTRAKKLLVIVGDSATIAADPFYTAMLAYGDQSGAYRSAWEYLHNES